MNNHPIQDRYAIKEKAMNWLTEVRDELHKEFANHG